MINKLVRFPRFRIIQLCLLSIFILSGGSAIAAGNSSPEFVRSFFEGVDDALIGAKNYMSKFENSISSSWSELNNDIQSAIDESIADLGIPDPIQSGQKIQIVIGDRAAEISQINPILQGVHAQKQWHQYYTLGQSESILGESGQDAMFQENQASSDAVYDNFDTADAAQSDLVTQDVMKKIAQQNAQNAVIYKSIQTEVQKQTQLESSANINLADISEHMNNQERRQQMDTSNQATQILMSAAFNDGFWQSRK